jgi:hypothetical protein
LDELLAFGSEDEDLEEVDPAEPDPPVEPWLSSQPSTSSKTAQ